jgi:hypothetical protein
MVDDKTPVEHCSEAYSKTYSSAARSMAMAEINISNTPNAYSDVNNKKVNHSEGIHCKVSNEKSAEDVNQWWLDEMGYDNPPYLPKSKVQEIELEEDTVFCRVYDGVNSGMYGGWVMKPSDIEGLNHEQIQDKFALPQKPRFMCDVMLPKGTKLRAGECNPLEGWGKGGGTQFDLMGQRVGEFSNEREILEKLVEVDSDMTGKYVDAGQSLTIEYDNNKNFVVETEE